VDEGSLIPVTAITVRQFRVERIAIFPVAQGIATFPVARGIATFPVARGIATFPVDSFRSAYWLQVP
jgi:hypothetical protein